MARTRLRWSRTWRQRLLLGVNIVLTMAFLVSGLGIGYAANRLSAIDRVDVNSSLAAPPSTRPLSAADITITGPPDSTTTTTEAPKPPGPDQNFLIVGSDNAQNIAAGDPILTDRDEELDNHLADTIMVLRVRPAEGTASLLSIPRDLEVTIAGSSRRAKINSAFNLPDRQERVARLLDTISENLDITVQHYVEVDLAAFRRLVDAVGGVQVCFPGPARDPATGLDVATPGWVELDGTAALAYVRSRKLQMQRLDGRWVNASPRADLDRIDRQQQFVRDAVDQALSGVVSSPATLIEVLDIAADTVVTSNSFSVVSDGKDLADWFSGFGSEQLDTMALAVFDLPPTPEHGNESRLGMLPQAQDQLDIFRGIDPDDVVPKRVELSVVGPDRSTAVAVGDALEALGFDVGTRSSGSTAEAGPQLRYGPGGHQAANLVAAFIDVPVTFVADETLWGNQVVLDLGSEPVVVLDEPRALEVGATPIALPTTTTAPAGTTTTVTTEQIYAFDCSASRE